ncbi:branched-chain amino acid ABC transporter substrate-binding protein [Martelella soudanensis]|uniref:branched-chain amino acid ABC transporter substrate-binding protein n=1 Tax=unclassified Martelella TaxID=2629616 RepID=UPI0015DDA87D|nr:MULTISPECIES: ABC transporter substrate-binding protein [unclassified Martelella]
MRSIPACLLGIAMSGFAAAPSFAAETLKIGIVAPLSGDYAILGEQALDGAGLAARNRDMELTTVDESCEDGSGGDVGQALADAGVDIAIGFFCSETVRGAMPVLRDAGIPAITLSARSMPLMTTALKESWPLFRMAPNDQDEIDATVDYIMGEWIDEPVALLDDGTIYFREMVNAVRNALEERGLQPVFVDTFRPAQEQQLSLVRRLAQTGATHVFIGGTRSDIAIVSRDAAQEGDDLTILGSDALRAQEAGVPLEVGVLAIALPEYGELPPAAALADIAASNDIVPEGYVVPAASAVEIAAEAMAAAEGDTARLTAMLATQQFDTALGPVSFTEGHELADNPYFLLRWQGNQFVPVFDSARQ